MKKNVYVFCMIILCSVLLYSEPPTNVEIHIDNDNSVLSWSDTTNADFYYIYRSTKPDTDFVKIDSVNVTTYIDSGAVTGNKYFYYVTAEEEEVITVTDIDGNVYQTVQIGDQLWMAENLKVTHYSNGDSIPNVTDNSTWPGLSTGAQCVYNNNSGNELDTYGRLYNWYAVDTGNLAPAGWRVPTDDEWQTLVDYLGGSSVAGGKMKEAGTAHWNSPNTGATNESGFTALPGGYRNYYGGYFTNLGYSGDFWSATELSTYYAWRRYLYYGNTQVGRGSYYKQGGYSVRCVRD